MNDLKPFMQFSQLSLRSYLPHEIKMLSMVDLNQTKTFDDAGFPIKGGLYDKAMGPLGPFETCETCSLKYNYCPGHFGHIQLSVPVFNPLFFSFTFNIMKGTCIHCHRFTCNTSNETILNFLKEWSSIPLDLVKNNVDIKHTLMKEFLRENLFKRRIVCPHCKHSNGILRNDSGRAFILDFSSSQSSFSKIKKTSKLSKYVGDQILDALEENDFSIKDIKKKKDKNLTDLIDSNSVLDPLSLSKKFLMQQLNYVVSGKCDKLIWRAVEVREHFRLLWQNENSIMRFFFPLFETNNEYNFCPMDVLFYQTLLVQPSKFRPQRSLRGVNYEHPTTANYRRVMEADQLLTVVKIVMTNDKSTVDAKALINNKVIGKTLTEKLHNAYLDLQVRVNCLYDQGADKYNVQQHPGLKQIIEKKQGIFRMNMMGKRVNYACRTVITPDPYLDIDEIGIPELFARRLTFPEPTNYLNIKKLREMICKGPSKYPGANFIQRGYNKQIILSGDDKVNDRIAMGKRLTTATSNENDFKLPTYVFRHLKKGDYLLMNRQPSLHKPSIMGHKARILKGQKALRMNYAPCKAYNADFDGDEMNGHFLQNQIAQSEASELANVGNNYLVPKDGTPILGLIQDHVVSGVLLTLRGRFLTKSLFMHLVFSAFSETTKRLIIPSPTMLKPEILWSGKQVITAILENCIPEGRSKINLTSKTKTALNCWKVPGFDTNLSFNMSESEVIFRNGELLCGVLDKQHYGATQFGLIHCCYELYGPRVGTKILSCFSRVFTTYLQHHGFTLGVADILVTKKADKQRRKTIRELRKVGPLVVQKTFGLPDDTTPEQIKNTLEIAYNNPRRDFSDVKQLDFTMKQILAKYSEQINNDCVPSGLIRCFPENSLQMMIQSGAKGSMVNSIQISCALGQIELEGQRPPLSAVGRTLPSFRVFDPSPRAGGFIDQRFLTGINPQELFFHTMAGREGLIDTAVKTSRSGYLQRCIIKHLEGISVRYDNTVRDHDGSVVQFRYGEDGLDVGRATFINSKLFKFLEDNSQAVLMGSIPKTIYNSNWNVRETEKHFKRLTKWKKMRFDARKIDETSESFKIFESNFLNFCNSEKNIGKKKKSLIDKWYKMSKEEKEQYSTNSNLFIDSIDVKFNPVTHLGALPEKILEEISFFVKKNNCSTDFKHILFWKSMRAYADPGENVGLLAAQSIGEPSTQMTLNTFHFAGRGEMNVTLGIPRLREILMTSGKNISTPMTEIVIRDGVSDEQIEKLKRELNPVFLNQLIKKFILEEQIENDNGNLYRCYNLTIELLRDKHREPEVQHVSRHQIITELERRFMREVGIGISKCIKDVLELQQIQHKRLRNVSSFLTKSENNENNDIKETDLGASSDEEEGDNNDAEEARLKKRHLDDGAEYEGEEEEEDEVKDKDEVENIDNFGTIDDDIINEEIQVLEDNNEELSSKFNNENVSNMEFDVLKVINKADLKSMNATRIQSVLKSHQLIVNYKYDSHSNRWCSTKYRLPLKNKTKLDIMTIIKNIVNKFVVLSCDGINKAVLREEERNGKTIKILQVQGVNMTALYSRSALLDVNTLYSNDVNFMLNKYGVEACGRTIAKEMNNVFSVYGIEVNSRHLSLTADHMTFTGQIQPFSRSTMASNASSLQKMTFETTAAFLRDTIITRQNDNLCSPSARLITGQIQLTGTGAFDLLQNPNYLNLVN